MSVSRRTLLRRTGAISVAAVALNALRAIFPELGTAKAASTIFTCTASTNITYSPGLTTAEQQNISSTGTATGTCVDMRQPKPSQQVTGFTSTFTQQLTNSSCQDLTSAAQGTITWQFSDGSTAMSKYQAGLITGTIENQAGAAKIVSGQFKGTTYTITDNGRKEVVGSCNDPQGVTSVAYEDITIAFVQ